MYVFVFNLYAAVNDLIPTDYETPLANSTIMSLNYFNKELGTASLNKDQYVRQNTYALRLNHAFEINEKILSLGLAIPYTNLSTHGDLLSKSIGDKSVGLSDTVFSATYWFVGDRKNKNFLGLTMTHYMKNGKYDESQLLNISENRYITTLAIGYITKLSDSFLFELSPEIGFYSDNNKNNSVIEQKNSYAITSNFRYKPSNKYELFIGFQENYLKDTVKNGIKQNDDHFYEKYSFGGAYYTDKFHQFMLRFATEANKEYGLEINNEPTAQPPNLNNFNF